MNAPVITIDGPSGAGKGTLSQWLSQQLGWHLLDSGSLYRLVALTALQQQTQLDDVITLVSHADNLQAAFLPAENGLAITLAGENVSVALRTEECGHAASVIAAIPELRIALLGRQRAFRQPPGLVADGRDMGTVVFPDADWKIFLTASQSTRIQRRHKQLIEKGINVTLPALSEDIRRRDERDASRQSAPLLPADDAWILDTTEMDIGAVCNLVLAKIRQQGLH